MATRNALDNHPPVWEAFIMGISLNGDFSAKWSLGQD